MALCMIIFISIKIMPTPGLLTGDSLMPARCRVHPGRFASTVVLASGVTAKFE
ncbi:hypothetical protein [Methanosphaerula palustris]|uniref:hypothetical protein n=1 Tax=Methanosphaerula palustris TaxID=475088 RepID=UPI0003262E3B|nr:hypothetical protein [Methanosphaerula palustris]